MDTLEFFKALYPEDGVKYLALINANGKVAHKAFTDLEAMAQAVAKYDAENLQVYHACATYKEAYVEVEGKRKYRIPQNQYKAKAFWLDIDCGQEKFDEGKGYLTKKEAYAAVKSFCDICSLHMPYIVDSGNGIHCYWFLTKSIPSDTWMALAKILKAATVNQKLIVDPTRTSDFASILRPIGSTNKKTDQGKPVVGQKTTSFIDPKEFAGRILALKKELNLALIEPKPAPINDDLTAHLPPSIPSFAEEVAQKCGQVAQMRDTKGDVSYEHWRGVIGIIKYCEEGEAKAHEWSSGHPNYNASDTQQKFDTWSTPPTTCEFFSTCNPKGCEGCQFKGKIKTPLVLGRREPEPEKNVEIEAKVDGKSMKVEIPEFPRGYGLEKGQLARFIKDKDDIMHAYGFCESLFYPTARIRKETGEFSLAMRMHLPDGRIRDFEIDTQCLASSQKVVDNLAKYELVPTNHEKSAMHMTAYLRDSLEKLKREAEELNTHTAFGWEADYQSFLVGDRLYCKDGTVKKVLVGGYAKDKTEAFPPVVGDVEKYAKAIDYVYNRPGMEPMQYAIASTFGSVFTPLGDAMYKGLVFAIVGPDTAKGKTTSCWAGLYAFGDADKMSLKTEDNATVNARYARMGAYKNIPILIDELTNIDGEEFSKFAYTVSLGQERERLTMGKGTGGIRFAESQNWAMVCFVTANKDLHSLLASRQGNTQAEAVRMIQINIDRYPLPVMKVSEVEAAKKQMEINKGAAGDLFLRYVVPNLDKVMELMVKWGKRIEEDVSDVKYRFYRSQAVTALAAVEITNELKITNFDIEAMYQFIIKLFYELAESVAEQNTITSEDALSRMLNDISPRILVTTEYRDGRDSRGPEDVRMINGAISGRYIVGNQNKDNKLGGKLYVIRKEITDWCLKHRVDYKSMIGAAIDAGLAVEMKDKFNIGRGTKISAGQHRCVEIDMLKLEATGTNAPRLTVYTANKIEGSQTVNS